MCVCACVTAGGIKQVTGSHSDLLVPLQTITWCITWCALTEGGARGARAVGAARPVVRDVGPGLARRPLLALAVGAGLGGKFKLVGLALVLGEAHRVTRRLLHGCKVARARPTTHEWRASRLPWKFAYLHEPHACLPARAIAPPMNVGLGTSRSANGINEMTTHHRSLCQLCRTNRGRGVRVGELGGAAPRPDRALLVVVRGRGAVRPLLALVATAPARGGHSRSNERPPTALKTLSRTHTLGMRH